MRTGILLASCLGAVLPSRAAAQTRHVAVIDIRGAGAKRVRAFLEKLIQERYRLVAREALLAAADELQIPSNRLRPSNLRQIARRARVDAVVSGYVYRSRRRWWLALRVQDGSTGKTVKKGVVLYPYFKLNRWTRPVLAKILHRGVAQVEGVEHPPPRPPPRARPRPSPEPPTPDEATGPRPGYLTGLEGGLGIGLWGRRLSFNRLNGEPGTQTLYETNTPIVPLSFFFETYPGAFLSRHRALANIGVGLIYQRAFGVVSYQADQDRQVSTTVQHVRGYVAYRWNLKRSETSPELKFTLGVDMLEFSFDQDLKEAAGVRYVSIRPAVQARFPLGTERVSLGVAVAGIGVLSLGQMQDPYHYGTSSGGGFELGLEVDVRIFWRLHALAGFSTTWYFISFTQFGEIHQNYEYTADSARDGYYGGYVRLAVYY